MDAPARGDDGDLGEEPRREHDRSCNSGRLIIVLAFLTEAMQLVNKVLDLVK
ncbi:hypothetical protein [Umezawaea tangerina]|uniref:hypothetical protein n=1 Tax=Umezawaea tangerina TaxID=84725 RepID=UPI001475A140|nr:hypothetical protein [Umezawaea tangerina]